MGTRQTKSKHRSDSLCKLVTLLGTLTATFHAFAQCDVRPQIQPNEVVMGTLASGDCITDELFADGDLSFADIYELALPLPGVVTVRMESAAVDSFLELYDPNLRALFALDDDGGGHSTAWFSTDLPAGNYTLLATSFKAESGAYTLTTSCSGCTVALAASVLPTSRAVQVGIPATAFATVINAGSTTATACGISPVTSVPASFRYQTTDPLTNAVTGMLNMPADIPAGASQTFVLAFTPTADLAPTDIKLGFDCLNSEPAPTTTGLNTLLLSASNSPAPDIVALAGTSTNDGIVTLNSLGSFVVATVNLGTAGTISATADTGNSSLPLSLAMCETDRLTSRCANPTAPTADPVVVPIANNATPTFAVFVEGDGDVPLVPATNRAFVRFKDPLGVTRGSTSVAVDGGGAPGAVPNVVADYVGSFVSDQLNCSDAFDDLSYGGVAVVSLSSQSDSAFRGAAAVKTFFRDISMDLTGTVAVSGSLEGSVTYDVVVDGMLQSSGDGSFSGTLDGNTLSFSLSLQDTVGNVCTNTASVSANR
jgi:hypothetical protein